jgi:CubicO group peptidase (beta-lactamase class C family)
VFQREKQMLNLHKLEQSVEEQMQAAQVPGVALAIIQGQEIIYARGFGVTSADGSGLPVTPHTLFRIGETTIPLTGTAVMRLVEAGKLALDKPIKEYINWFTLKEEGAAEQVTLRMLMSHTSGLPTDYKPYGRREPSGLEEYVRQEIPRYPLYAPPGKLYRFSVCGINVAGYIAQVVTGKLYTELMRELVFDPLDMKRTTFDPTVAMTYPLAQLHDHDGAVIHRFPENSSFYPSGYAMSTVLDLANFAMMQMNHGRFRDEQILAPESVAEMHRQQVSWYILNQGYGLGFHVGRYKEKRLIAHSGGFGCQLTMLPSAGVAVIVLFNHAEQFWPVIDEVVNPIFDQLLDLPQSIPEPQPLEPDRSLWHLYTGTYLGRPEGGMITIQIVDGHLTLDWHGDVFRLELMDKHLYRGKRAAETEKYWASFWSSSISVGFIPEDEGQIQFIMINGEFTLKRFERDLSYVPDPAIWSKYVGTYRDHSGGTGMGSMVIRLKEGRPFIYSKLFDTEFLCTLLSDTCVVCKLGVFEVQVNDNGIVTKINNGAFSYTRE